jgi:hypothetical protein
MLGKLFAGPIVILYIGLGAWGFFLVSQYIAAHFGFIGVVIAVFVLPVAYGLTPLWAGLADGYWLPALVCYSPMVLMMAIGMIGSAFEGRR